MSDKWQHNSVFLFKVLLLVIHAIYNDYLYIVL